MDPEAVRLELLCDPAPTSAGLQGDVGDTPLPALHPDAEAVARALEALVPGHARLRIQRGGLEHGLVMIDRGVHDVFGLRFEFLYRHYGGLTEAPSLHPDHGSAVACAQLAQHQPLLKGFNLKIPPDTPVPSLREVSGAPGSQPTSGSWWTAPAKRRSRRRCEAGGERSPPLPTAATARVLP